jgi:citrate lyase subunit beta / citryl-CoA lyase
MTYRSMLFTPGNRPSRMTRALGSAADAVVLDLEDSVPEEQREQARAAVAQCLSEVPGGVDCWVRVVAVDRPGLDLDLDAAVRPGLTGVVLPGVDGPAAVRTADDLISGIERRRSLPAGSVALLPLAESALGVRNLFDSLTASRRVTATSFPGAAGADLCSDLGAVPTAGGTELLHARSKVLLDARAAGVTTILDGVWVDLDDPDGLRRDTAFGRRIGYTGRFAIHPAQLPVLHEVFTPSARELRDARELLAAYADARSRGDGALRHRGRLVDRAMAARAERLLTSGERSGARQ